MSGELGQENKDKIILYFKNLFSSEGRIGKGKYLKIFLTYGLLFTVSASLLFPIAIISEQLPIKIIAITIFGIIWILLIVIEHNAFIKRLHDLGLTFKDIPWFNPFGQYYIFFSAFFKKGIYDKENKASNNKKYDNFHNTQ